MERLVRWCWYGLMPTPMNSTRLIQRLRIRPAAAAATVASSPGQGYGCASAAAASPAASRWLWIQCQCPGSGLKSRPRRWLRRPYSDSTTDPATRKTPAAAQRLRLSAAMKPPGASPPSPAQTFSTSLGRSQSLLGGASLSVQTDGSQTPAETPTARSTNFARTTPARIACKTPHQRFGSSGCDATVSRARLPASTFASSSCDGAAPNGSITSITRTNFLLP
jgi:hypothetical protein